MHDFEKDPPSHTVAADVEAVMNDFDQYYREQVQRFLQRLERVSGLTPLVKPFEDYLTRPGKRIRPRLLLAACQAFSQPANPAATLLGPACGLELFHAFVLIHDDLIDGAETRRGQPALHRAIAQRLHCSPERGKAVALVLGDILFSFAAELFSNTSLQPEVENRLRQCFLDMAAQTGSGQAAELVASTVPIEAVDEQTIAEIYYGKTTHYTFEVPLQMGALAAGADARTIRSITHWARPLGLAFQIENDLHEIRSLDEHAPALPLDFQAGMKTLFFKRFFSREGATHLDDWQQILAQGRPDDLRWKSIILAMRDSPSLKELENEVAVLFQQARERIDQCGIAEDSRQLLQRLVDTLMELRHHSEALLLQKPGISS